MILLKHRRNRKAINSDNTFGVSIDTKFVF